MNGALASHLGDAAALGQAVALQPQAIAANGASSLTALPQLSSVQALLAQLEQVAESANQADAIAMPETAEPVIAESEVTGIAQAPIWMPAMPAMQPGLPLSMQAKTRDAVGPLTVLVAPNHPFAGKEVEAARPLLPSLHALRSDAAQPMVALPIAAAPQAVDAGATLASQVLSISASIADQPASVRMGGMGAADLASPSAKAVSVQQGPQALVQALAQRLQVQQVQGNQVAVVRLDPPHMGVIELRISHDATGIQVHMQASNSEVGRQLTVLAEPLRQELLGRSADAHITVSSSRSFGAGGQSDAQRQASTPDEEPEIGQALDGADHGHTSHT